MVAVAGIEPACAAYETAEIAKTSLPPNGATERIRTSNLLVLSQAPLPVGPR